jgi:hypothetical protein
MVGIAGEDVLLWILAGGTIRNSTSLLRVGAQGL